MTLNSHANYPSTRSYVLKLHRDATPQRGQIAGRLENIASGRCFDFSTGEPLLACLVLDAAASCSEVPSPLVGEGQGEG